MDKVETEKNSEKLDPCDYPYGHKKNDMCYTCYLEQMKDYNFCPLKEDLWKYWRDFHSK